jgi:TetR/AcrR family transcriptional regulator, fatty acid metabolism regulator protein
MTVHSSPDRPERGDRGDRNGDKRERILAAAERIFARHGFFAARVSEIAREAGVADGTIYLYFKSKDDLLISLFENRMKQVNDQLRRAIADQPPAAQLRAFIQTYLQLVSDEPTAAEVLTIELRQSSKFMKEYDNPQFADFLRMLGGIIADGQARGELDAAIPSHIAARMIFGIVDELALAWVLAKQPLRAAAPAASAAISGPAPGTRPKKFDIVRAADWVVAMVTGGLEKGQPNKTPKKETPS